ncbi:MAG TPA: ATP-binding protein [Leptolinea sp.]
MNQSDIDNAVSAIRNRLFLLLLQSFTAVIGLLLILVLGAMIFLFYRVANFYPPFRPMLSSVLESYYLGHGNWEGVQTLLPKMPRDPMSMDQNEWWDSILLDQNKRILIDHGNPGSERVGSVYSPDPEDSPVPVRIQGKQVGTLIVTRLPNAFDMLNSLALPFGSIIVFLAILTMVIGLLLSQRLINPLAEVIAAARAVTSGKLATRVKVQGPDDLRVLTDSFNQMATSLEKNDKEQRNLIADIAHELRTPLAIVQGRLEGIVDGIYPADQAHIQPILQETCQLERLISDLDMLAQAASNQLIFNKVPVSLMELSQQAIIDFETEASEKQITIRNINDAYTPNAWGDSQRISQVINNLLSNALRYIPIGGEVILRISPVMQGVELTISDNGPGIPAEDLPYIFDRFWRGEKSRSRVWGGAGLGLAIARQFIEIQGGRIWAINRPEGGLQVGFVLPAVTA